jgi:nucleoside-triphosphatase THEP1
MRRIRRSNSMRVSIIFAGPRGTGKSTLCNVVRDLLKDKGYAIKDGILSDELDVRWSIKEVKE